MLKSDILFKGMNRMIRNLDFPFLEKLAKGIVGQFGSNCEVTIHDLTGDPEHTITVIENGSVTGRKVGDGPSRVVLEALNNPEELQDRFNYLTQTDDGRMLKSSTIYMRDDAGKIIGIFAINYDITNFMLMENTMRDFLRHDADMNEPPKINKSVNDLLGELITQAVDLVGKPVSHMTRDDKVKAIKFLSSSGAFLITKSGDKVSKYFGISKYTLYNYLGTEADI
jgi:predicted transcriptional regulator YheO